MTDLETVRTDDGLRALKERKRLVDDVWLLACFAVLAAVGVPWYLRLLDIELAPVAWSLFAYGLIYVFTSALRSEVS